MFAPTQTNVIALDPSSPTAPRWLNFHGRYGGKFKSGFTSVQCFSADLTSQGSCESSQAGNLTEEILTGIVDKIKVWNYSTCILPVYSQRLSVLVSFALPSSCFNSERKTQHSKVFISTKNRSVWRSLTTCKANWVLPVRLPQLPRAHSESELTFTTLTARCSQMGLLLSYPTKTDSAMVQQITTM